MIIESRGFDNDSVVRTAKVMSIEAEKILKEKNPNLKQVHVAFNNGGYVVNKALEQLSPEYRDTVVVIAVGTTETINDEMVCQVYNEIGNEDWASRRCNGGKSGLKEASKTATIEFVEQTETHFGIGGHYFTQPDYLNKIAEIITDRISEKYEISK